MRNRSLCFFLVFLSVYLIGAAKLGAQTTRQIDVASKHAKELKILRSAGAGEVSPQVLSVQVNSRELLFERVESPMIRFTPGPVSKDKSSSATELPFLFRGVKTDGSPLDLVTVVDRDPRSGLEYSPESKKFSGTLYIGVQDKLHPGEAGALPVPIEFLITADIGHKPSSVTLNHVNQPFVAVAISDEAPKEPVKVGIRPSFSSEEQTLELNVNRPALSIEVSPLSIWGLGLAEGGIVIRAKDMTIRDLPIVLSATKGDLKDLNVKTNESGIATTKIRSINVGSATIRAESPGFVSANANVIFAIPWVFLLAALLGSICGIIARNGLKLTLRNIFGGIGLGLLCGVGYTVGVNLTGFQPSAVAGEALIFFVAGIVTFIGHI